VGLADRPVHRDAWLKVYPDDRGTARHFLDGFEPRLAEAGIGSISEVFNAEPPFMLRGCIAQAWSVAEVLRCLKRLPSSRNENFCPVSPAGCTSGVSR
jgi:glycogen debranching enzyme